MFSQLDHVLTGYSRLPAVVINSVETGREQGWRSNSSTPIDVSVCVERYPYSQMTVCRRIKSREYSPLESEERLQ